jgi:heptosyltransferase-3
MNTSKKLSEKPVILVSRTDSIGDVVLTLPLCGWIKEQYPSCHLIFLGRTYTKAVVDCCIHVDAFLNWDDLLLLPAAKQKQMLAPLKIDVIIHVFPVRKIAAMAYQAGIPKRIGTSSRLYHLLYCNALVPLNRKNSGLHEAWLNLLLLKGLGKLPLPTNEQLYRFSGLHCIPSVNKEIQEMIHSTKINLILHPGSKGSARDWPLSKYLDLINSLPSSQYAIFISGTKEDQLCLKPWTDTLPAHVHNISGRFSLSEFIAFINQCDGLIAASTGPLHLAASLGKIAIGLYPPIRPMDPGRWAPIGPYASFVVLDKKCVDCRNTPAACACMRDLEVSAVLLKLQELSKALKMLHPDKA